MSEHPQPAVLLMDTPGNGITAREEADQGRAHCCVVCGVDLESADEYQYEYFRCREHVVPEIAELYDKIESRGELLSAALYRLEAMKRAGYLDPVDQRLNQDLMDKCYAAGIVPAISSSSQPRPVEHGGPGSLSERHSHV